MNNYERIKSMTVDEMNKWLDIVTSEPCKKICKGCLNVRMCHESIKQWLLSEVEDE